MDRKWMTLVGGLLAILSGCFKLIGVLILSIAIIAVEAEGELYINEVNPVHILLVIVIPLAVVALLAIVGGVYALKRKRWGLAVAGSVAATLPFDLLGIAALVLIALARDEFEYPPKKA